MLSISSLVRLKEQLPPIDFSTAGAVFNASAEVQSYLDYYQINFARELVNIQHHFGYFEAAGYRLACHVWRPFDSLINIDQNPEQAELQSSFKGMVWFLHGYTDHVGVSEHIIRWLLQQGYGVVCFDLPGHGLSSGIAGSIGSFDEYRDVLIKSLELAGEQLPGPRFGIGHSTGCSVLLNLLGCYPQRQDFKKVILLAPLIRPHRWSITRWVFYVLRTFMPRITRGLNSSSHDQEFLDFIAYRDPLQFRHIPMAWMSAMDHWVNSFEEFSVQSRPIYIVQGDNDQTVDYRYNIGVIEQKFDRTDIKIIAGGKHQLVNESVDYRQQVWDAIFDVLKD